MDVSFWGVGGVKGQPQATSHFVLNSFFSMLFVFFLGGGPEQIPHGSEESLLAQNGLGAGLALNAGDCE